eukprot:452275_1
MSLLILLFVINTTYSWKLYSEQCRSVDVWSEPLLPLDVCSNSKNEKYRGSYSEKYICDTEKNYVNTSFYWGYECLGKSPFFSTKYFPTENITHCYNRTIHPYWEYNLYNLSNQTNLQYAPNDTIQEEKCITYTEVGDNDWIAYCDKSYPICEYANWTVYSPLPDVRDCSIEKDKTNFKTDSIVINDCTCHTFEDYDYEWDDINNELNFIPLGNVTDCYTKLCNDTGIYAVYLEDVDVELLEQDPDLVCKVDIEDLNFTDWNVWIIFEEGCDDISGEYTEIFCPTDECYVWNYSIGFIVAMMVGYMHI